MTTEPTADRINALKARLGQLVLDLERDLMVPLREIATRSYEERQQARREVLAFVGILQSKLKDALGGAVLHGTPNISSSVLPLEAWHVRRTPPDSKLKYPKQGEGLDYLVLSKHGDFAIAELTREREDVSLEMCEPDVDDFHVEDLVPCVRTVVVACAAHLTAAPEGTKRVREVRELKDRLLNALEEPPDRADGGR